MQLILNTGALGDQGVIDLPNDLMWADEFNWVPAVQTKSFSLTGALIIETGLKQAGRPISLQADNDMAWVSRSVIMALRAWAALSNRQFTLAFEYPTDTRSFTVAFDQEGGTPVQATSVKGFPQHGNDDWFTVRLKLIQV